MNYRIKKGWRGDIGLYVYMRWNAFRYRDLAYSWRVWRISHRSVRFSLSLSLFPIISFLAYQIVFSSHTVRRSRHATETNSLSYGSDETSNPKVELKFHGRVLPATINDVFLPHSLLPLIFSLLLLLSRECARSMCVRGVFRCGEDRRGTLNHRPIPSPRWIVHLYTRTPFALPFGLCSSLSRVSRFALAICLRRTPFSLSPLPFRIGGDCRGSLSISERTEKQLGRSGVLVSERVAYYTYNSWRNHVANVPFLSYLYLVRILRRLFHSWRL